MGLEHLLAKFDTVIKTADQAIVGQAIEEEALILPTVAPRLEETRKEEISATPHLDAVVAEKTLPLQSGEPLQIDLRQGTNEKSEVQKEAALHLRIVREMVNHQLWGNGVMRALDSTYPHGETNEGWDQVENLIPPLSAERLTDLTEEARPIRQTAGGVLPESLSEQNYGEIMEIIEKAISVTETEPLFQDRGSKGDYRRQAQTVLEVLQQIYAQSDDKRNFSGLTEIPDEQTRALQEQIKAFSQPVVLGNLFSCGLVPTGIMSEIIAKLPGDATGKETMGLVRAFKEEPAASIRIANQVLGKYFDLYGSLTTGASKPDRLRVATGVMLRNLQTVEAQLEHLDGHAEATKEQLTTALDGFRQAVEGLQRACNKALGAPCLTYNPIATEELNNQTLEPIVEEGKPAFLSQRVNLILAAWPGAVQGRTETHPWTQERKQVVDIAPMARSTPVEELLVDALERFQTETAGSELANGIKGITRESLDAAMKRIYPNYDPKKERKYLDQALTRYSPTLDGHIPAHAIFETALILAQEQGIIAEYENLVNPLWATLACEHTGQALRELSSLPSSRQTQYALLLSLGKTLSLSEIFRVLRKAEREHGQEFARSVEGKKEGRPAFLTDTEIIAQLKPHFPGQDKALKRLVRACTSIEANVSKSCGYEPLNARIQRDLGKIVEIVLGMTGIGKTSAIEYLRRVFPNLDFHIQDVMGMAPKPWRAKDISDIFLAGIEEVQERRGISFEATCQRAEGGQIVFVIDNVHEIAESSEFKPQRSGSSEVDTPRRLIQQMFLKPTGNESHLVKLERPDPRTNVLVSYGTLETINVPWVFMGSGEGPVQEYAKQRVVAETGNPLANLPPYVDIKNDDLGRIFYPEFAGRFKRRVINFEFLTREMIEKTLRNLKSDRAPLLLLGNTISNYLDLFGDRTSRIVLTPEAEQSVVDYAEFYRTGYRAIESAMIMMSNVICGDYERDKPYNGREIIIDEAFVLKALPELEELPELRRKREARKKAATSS